MFRGCIFRFPLPFGEVDVVELHTTRFFLFVDVVCLYFTHCTLHHMTSVLENYINVHG